MPNLNRILDTYQYPVTLLFVSSYIPRKCGIATFTKDLTKAINDLNPESLVEIVAMGDESSETYHYPPEVVATVEKNTVASYHAAANHINASDASIVSLQHEFGLFGGDSGDYIFEMLDRITKPVVTTMHTILDEPTAQQRSILFRLAERSEVVVVMIPDAKARLERDYGIPTDKVVVIHHGVADQPKSAQIHKPDFGWEGKRVLLMTGLFNPNKGANYVIEALPTILAAHPEAIFVIAGQTHPEIIKREGESYRNSLRKKAEELGVTDQLIFIDEYLPLKTLLAYYEACDIYLTPHLDAQQTTSGTLAYALGLGKACISTPYTYAREMLAHDRGILVPFRDAAAIAEAVNEILSDDYLQKTLEARAYSLGRQMSWPRIAERYLLLFRVIEKKYDLYAAAHHANH